MSVQIISFNDGPLEGERRRVDVGSEGEPFKISMYDVEEEPHTYEINPNDRNADYVILDAMSFVEEALAIADMAHPSRQAQALDQWARKVREHHRNREQ